MSRFSRLSAACWIGCVILSGALFSFLSYHPEMMLWIEDIHPSNAYDQGRILRDRGQTDKAIRYFEKGRDYFERIYRETGLERHKNLYAHGILEIANTYSRSDNPDDLERAVRSYLEGLELSPRVSEGHPHLALGFVFQRLNRHLQAIDSFSNAINFGSALISLQALLGRGDSYLKTNQPEKACNDWYYFVRYYDRITDNDWETVMQLPVLPDIRSEYIRGRACQGLLDTEQAKPHLKRYTEQCPQDRSARFWYSQLINAVVIPDAGLIPLEDCYPVLMENPRLISTDIIDIYMDRDCLCKLSFALSASGKTPELDRLIISRNRMIISEITLNTNDLNIYTETVELIRGINYFQLNSKYGSEFPQKAELWLHRLELMIGDDK